MADEEDEMAVKAVIKEHSYADLAVAARTSVVPILDGIPPRAGTTMD